MENLTGNIALVTGAGQGIGKAIAIELAACGAQVAVVDINLPQAEKVTAQIKLNKGKAFPIQADVSAVEEVKAMTEKIINEYDRIDILVNNVGISPKNEKGERISILEMDPDQ